MHVRTKEHWYDALRANGFYLAAYSSPFITLKLLKEIYTGECYCPQASDIRVHNVLHPPTSEQLVSIIITAIEENGEYESQQEEKAYR